MIVTSSLLLMMAMIRWWAGENSGVLLRLGTLSQKLHWLEKKGLKRLSLENPILFTHNLQTEKEVKFIKEMIHYK